VVVPTKVYSKRNNRVIGKLAVIFFWLILQLRRLVQGALSQIEKVTIRISSSLLFPNWDYCLETLSFFLKKQRNGTTALPIGSS